MPTVDVHGYTGCTVDADCGPGRTCDLEICAPPEWHDENFGQRQLLVVENRSALPIEAGAVIPVLIGSAQGVIPVENLGPEGRFTFFDGTEWIIQSAYIDRYSDSDKGDRLLAQLPLMETIGAGEKGVLTWIETDNDDKTLTRTEFDGSIFNFFDGFDPNGVDDIRVLDEVDYRIFGGDILVRDGAATIGDGQQIALRQALRPPVQVTFYGSFNQTTCRSVFFGLHGQTGLGYAPPSVMFAVDENFDVAFELAPNENAAPRTTTLPTPLDNLRRRYVLEIADGKVRALIDDEVFAEELELRPGFTEESDLFVTFDVDGNNCSFNLDELRINKLPIPPPQVTVESPVGYVAYSE